MSIGTVILQSAEAKQALHEDDERACGAAGATLDCLSLPSMIAACRELLWRRCAQSHRSSTCMVSKGYSVT